jgi:Flp pilus assembly pilin Flp
MERVRRALRTIERYGRDTSGVSAAEWALVLAIVGIGIVTAANLVIKTAGAGGLLSWPDLVAAGIGMAVGLAALFRGRKDHNERFFTAFGNGASAAYFAMIAYGIAFDARLMTTLLQSNSVVLLGCLFYASFISLRSLRTIF